MNQTEGIPGSHYDVVCQICQALGHSAIHCPNCYTPKPQLMLLAYATFNFVSVYAQVWYVDSAMTSHMTPNDGKLLVKSIYSLPKINDFSTVNVVGNKKYLVGKYHLPLFSHDESQWEKVR